MLNKRPYQCGTMANIALPNTQPIDPSEIGWPPTLPLELALKQAPVKDICLSYGLGKSDWDRLRNDENFIRALEEATNMLQQEGASFKAKLRAQAEGILPQNWALIHGAEDKVPANVKAQLIMFTIRAAGLDASIEQKAKAAGIQNNANIASITLILGDDNGRT